MKRQTMRWAGYAAMIAGLAFSVGSCVDEKIVYRDRQIPSTPSAAAGFVGYVDRATSKTVCGNCHVGHQGQWVQTAHASAWTHLEKSGSMVGTCQACHTVNNLGNAVTDTAVGYRSTKDVRYQDVQCESCHGPGLNHITNPEVAANRPLATLKADSLASKGCGGCHSGTHEPFVNEWQKSGHSKIVPSVINNYATDPVANAYCLGCHTAQGVLANWGVNAEFAESKATMPNHEAITCAVCHDPHSKKNDKQLRFPVDVANVEQNLCMKCHHRRATTNEVTTRNSPHSPEGPVLVGTAGWWPPNVAQLPDNIVATHGSERNPKLCATCHVSRFTVNDKATGKFSFQVTGHRFTAIPCLDATGIPSTNQNCAESQRTFAACAASGCHGSQAAARTVKSIAETRIATLAAEVDRLLALPAPKADINLKDTKYSTAEGAQFNAALARSAGSVVHNPFLIEALLTASIAQVKKDYSVQVAEGLDLHNILPRQGR